MAPQKPGNSPGPGPEIVKRERERESPEVSGAKSLQLDRVE